MDKPYHNRDWLYHQYWVLGKSTYQIANECGLNWTRMIIFWMKKFGIPRRNYSDATKGRKHKPYCQCIGCKYKRGEVRLGKNNPVWKGNEAKNDGTYRARARKIWSEFYGVKIPKGFIIHHIDGNIKNNDISNLMLLPSQKAHLKLHAYIRAN